MKEKFTVGRCDITVEKALSARFNVLGVPSIYLYRNGQMWSYYGPLVVESIVDFATKLYLKDKALDFMSSPVGPIGVTKGLMIRVGATIMESLPMFTEKFGIPNWAALIILVSLVTGAILFTAFVGAYISITHAKND